MDGAQTNLEKSCPYCRETIDADAMRCRFCFSSLDDDVSDGLAASGNANVKARSLSALLKISIALVGLAAFLAWRFGLLNESSSNEMAQHRAAIEVCWKDFNLRSAAVSENAPNAAACNEMEMRFKAKWGREAYSAR
ncbi:hypothetical protein GSY71_09240 [Pusillimonas sp. TS35]|uniref:hypothetical protein n=1 Tax=Paracandidimonas lactea TaxID=2895524 RepID=UPI0013696315|nr:hypothetical protein [Paracandidimonas lactea]MYN13324.1 hypothetical protein [Pusillimonas sp. TS35]